MSEPIHEPTDDECLLNDLAHEFTQRLRQGEYPTPEEYAQRYPHLSQDIHEIFPTLMLMESPQASTSETSARGRQPAWQLQRDRLGEYRILREVGRGGMGVVYEAIQETLGRRVALKVLPAIGDARQLERFRREARVAAHLHHTNIVPVYDVGEANGLHYYSMQFIDALPLHALLDDQDQASFAFTLNFARWQAAQLAEIAAWEDRTLPPSTSIPQPESRQDRAAPSGRVASSAGLHSRSRTAHYRHVARLGKQVADALAYAQGEGVLHRDIKPANLLLDARGTVWITDFGLARVEGQDELTSPGDVVGTLRYLPPERFEGHVDERGDIYSLGVTLYELLTSRPAFAASTRARLIDQILNAAPTAPHRIDPRVPRDLETIVLKAMSREPTHRYPRAAALAEDLDRYITGRPISARRVSAWGHTWRWCRRNRAMAAMVALAAVLFVAVFVVSLVDSVKIRSQLQETQLARREARERLFDSLVSQAHARWMGVYRFGRRFETLALVREAKELAHDLQLSEDSYRRLRNEAIAALCLPDVEYTRLVDAFPMGSAVVDFDPDIQRYARGDIEGNVTIHRVSDNRVLHRLPSSGPGFEMNKNIWDSVAFSPDATYLKQRCVDLAHDKSHLRLWDVSTTEPRLAFELSERIVGLTAFAPDGRHLGVVIQHYPVADTASSKATTQVHILEASSGRDAAKPLAADDTSRLVFHPTEAQLAVSDATAVRVVQWETGAELGRWNRPGTEPLAWSRDGRQLLARGIDPRDPKIYRWDVELQRELPSLVGPTQRRAERIVFSHRGDLFVSTPQFHVNIWDFQSGQLLWDFVESALPGIKFSRDDQLLAGAQGVYPEVRIMRFADGLGLRKLPLESPLDNGFPRAVMSHDGRMLAATSKRGTLLLDLQTFEELAVIPGIRIPLAFEPDGSLLTHANAPEGVVRWPMIVDPEPRSRISIGGPQSLTEMRRPGDSASSLFAGLESWAASRDGRVIATPWQDPKDAGANVFIADGSDRAKFRRLVLGPQHDVHGTSVSPDGKYVATGSINWWAKRGAATNSVTVWDATTGQRIKDLLVGEGFPQFSPDGNWIAVMSTGFPENVRLWQVGSWQPAPPPGPIEGPGLGKVAFDAESRLMAVEGHRIRLLVPETGREVAWLSISEETSLAPQCFTPDGTRLIAFGVHNAQLYAWDLRAIRRQLAELGLDWDAPPYEAMPVSAARSFTHSAE